jgi:hypothetical protein
MRTPPTKPCLSKWSSYPLSGFTVSFTRPVSPSDNAKLCSKNFKRLSKPTKGIHIASFAMPNSPKVITFSANANPSKANCSSSMKQSTNRNSTSTPNTYSLSTNPTYRTPFVRTPNSNAFPCSNQSPAKGFLSV